jgi:hypothetical protein
VKIGRPLCAGCVNVTMCLGGKPSNRIGRQKYYLHRMHMAFFFGGTGPMSEKYYLHGERGVAQLFQEPCQSQSTKSTMLAEASNQ